VLVKFKSRKARKKTTEGTEKVFRAFRGSSVPSVIQMSKKHRPRGIAPTGARQFRHELRELRVVDCLTVRGNRRSSVAVQIDCVITGSADNNVGARVGVEIDRVVAGAGVDNITGVVTS